MDGIDLDRVDIQCEFDCNLDQLFILVLYLVQCIYKSQRVTINFMMSVCLSICPHGTTQLPLDRFS